MSLNTFSDDALTSVNPPKTESITVDVHMR